MKQKLQQLLHLLKVWYWREKYLYHCTGVDRYCRYEPNPDLLKKELERCDYYERRLNEVGESV